MKKIKGRLNSVGFISIFVFLVVTFIFQPLYAKERLLVFPFRMLTSGNMYTKEGYKLSIYIADKIIKTKKNPYRVYILKGFNSLNDIPDDVDEIIKLGSDNSIDRILYGYFDCEGGSIKIYAKLLLVDSKIQVDVDDSYPILYGVVSGLAKISMEEIKGYKGNGRRIKEIYLKPEATFLGGEEGYETNYEEETGEVKKERKKVKIVMHTSVGLCGVVGAWEDIYDKGVFCKIGISAVSRNIFLPVTFGVMSRYSIFSRGLDDRYISSGVYNMYLGPSIEYRVGLRRLIKWIDLSMSGGFAISNLVVNREIYTSNDPAVNMEIGIGLFKRLNYSLDFKLGYFSIIYVEDPLESVYFSFEFIGG